MSGRADTMTSYRAAKFLVVARQTPLPNQRGVPMQSSTVGAQDASQRVVNAASASGGYDALIAEILRLPLLSTTDERNSKWVVTTVVEPPFGAPFAFRVRDLWSGEVTFEFVTPKENVWAKLQDGGSAGEPKALERLRAKLHSYRFRATSESMPVLRSLSVSLEQVKTGLIPIAELVTDGTTIHIRAGAASGNLNLDLTLSDSADLTKWVTSMRDLAWPGLQRED
jgi:hypothetical protein